MRVIMVLIVATPPCPFHPRPRRTSSTSVRRMQASLLWTLTPCPFSAVSSQRPLDCSATETEANRGRARVVPVNRSQSLLPTTTLAALSPQISARFSVKVGRMSPPSRCLLNSGRSHLRHKQTFGLRPPPCRPSPPLLPRCRNVALPRPMENSQGSPTHTAARSAQRARHQPWPTSASLHRTCQIQVSPTPL